MPSAPKEAFQNLDWTAGLDDGDMAVDGVMVLKVMNKDGHIYNAIRCTRNFGGFEAVGMLLITLNQFEAQIRAQFEDREPDA